MKTTNQVIEAVKNGTEVTELELKCAVVVLSTWRNGLVYDLARAITESEDDKLLTSKTQRGLKRAWEALYVNFGKDLATFVMGSSFEPGISKETRIARMASSTTHTANRLLDILKGHKDGP